VWASGAALTITLAMIVGLLAIVLANGLGVYWPAAVTAVTLDDGSRLLGELLQTDTDSETGRESVKYRVGNLEDGPAFRWVPRTAIREAHDPADAIVLERLTNMNYYGYLVKVQTPALAVESGSSPAAQLTAAMRAAEGLQAKEVAPLVARQQAAAKALNSRVKYALLKAAYRQKKLAATGCGADDPSMQAVAAEIAALHADENQLKSEADHLTAEVTKAEAALRKNVAVFRDAQGRTKTIPLVEIVRSYYPNQMGLAAKLGHYGGKVWELLSTDPRESNQDGGLFPAIFGTVLMVFLMAVLCFPLGVLAGIYLGAYAKQGPLVQLVRIAVNNLAGIPSIVYGIFGLGFFIYLVGGHLDAWLFPERVAASEPVYGQGCILWASLTLGLLTIPVVIVSTEEALRTIPRVISESSYALGGTKYQTLWRVLLPMASPGMMTGFILAMARAAGEVAPLMLTGAVKNAPLPLDASLPCLHLDRQFMHLGFHILDISCKSPNVEATKPMVYVTTLLLLAIVLVMSSVAIHLRNRMRKKFQARTV
jgi:phosphate transport system permease protein